LFAKASENAFSLPDTASAAECRSICRYIISITRRSQAHADLYWQVSSLLRRLELPNGARFFVPKTNEVGVKLLVDSWEKVAITIEKKHSDIDLKTTITSTLKEAVKEILLTQIKHAIEDTQFKTSDVYDKATKALNSVQAAEAEFPALKDETQNNAADFQLAVEEYRKQQERKAKIDAISTDTIFFIP
jgi:hypothetical protein